jgi:oligosaccharyl transferase complex subunit OST4
MITDGELHSLAVFLGSAAMILIILYHYLEVNAKEDTESPLTTERKVDITPGAKAKA